MATNKRMRGIAIHRSILIGSTATPLSAVEKITCPPDHTHKWTVAVRSAASHPLPTINDSEASTSASTSTLPSAAANPIREDVAAQNSGSTSQTHSGVSTRGREHETDYHKMVGGKDDISHFIKRVQFKLHETYPQSTRNIDRPPFQVTETGWGEFDIMVRIMFVPESGEKPLTVYHRLKLHPWHPVTLRAPEAGPSISVEAAIEEQTHSEDVTTQLQFDADEDSSIQIDVDQSAIEKPSFISPAQVPPNTADSGNSNANLTPVVHSWMYDEVVFPEPTEAFYEILLANPPTPLPTQSSQAYSDVNAHQKYKEALANLDESSGPGGRDLVRDSGVKPPHPVHNSSGALFDALSQEAIQAEAERFDKARFNAVYQLEETRTRLIDCERKLREGKGAASRLVPL